MKKMIGFFLIIALLIGASLLNGFNHEIISSYNKLAIVSSNYVEEYKDKASIIIFLTLKMNLTMKNLEILKA